MSRKSSLQFKISTGFYIISFAGLVLFAAGCFYLFISVREGIPIVNQENIIFAIVGISFAIFGLLAVFFSAELILDKDKRLLIIKKKVLFPIWVQTRSLDHYNKITINEVVHEGQTQLLMYEVHLVSERKEFKPISIDTNTSYAHALSTAHQLAEFLEIPFVDCTTYQIQDKEKNRIREIKLPVGSRIKHTRMDNGFMINIPEIGIQAVDRIYFLFFVIWPFLLVILMKPLLAFPKAFSIFFFALFGLYPVFNVMMLIIKTSTISTHIYVHDNTLEINQKWALNKTSLRIPKDHLKTVSVSGCEKRFVKQDLDECKTLKIAFDRTTVECGDGLDFDELRWVQGMIKEGLKI